MEGREDYNYAVCGPSGVGKSYFINALRGVRPGDARAAAVGVTETTHDIFRYDFPEERYLKLWDLPGFGTARHPTDTYARDKALIAFDAVLIMYSDRLLAGIVDIVRILDAANVPVAVVRTRADRSVEDLMADRGLSLGEARREVRRQHEATMRAELGARAGTMRSFVVCMRDYLLRKEANFDEDSLRIFASEAARARRG